MSQRNDESKKKHGELADAVRDYAAKHYIQPARLAGHKTVEIRPADIHRALNYHNQMPLACTALEAIKFRREHNLKSMKIQGPGQSTTTLLTFEL